MPSRRAVWLIAVFWLAVTGYTFYREVWPTLISSEPPPVGIELADEARQNIPVRWNLTWNGRPVGRLTTLMTYVESDDTFWFTTHYRDVRLEISGVSLHVPTFTDAVRVGRDGRLHEQSAAGEFVILLGDLKLADASLKLHGTVTAGTLTSRCTIRSTFGDLDRDLDPVPVPAGQPLNPLLPVNRLAGVRPGREWVVHISNPLADALTILLREKASQYGLKLPEPRTSPLYATVGRHPQLLERPREQVPCWVIDYRRDEPVARTWVRVADGRVLRQEVFQKGETLTIDRED